MAETTIEQLLTLIVQNMVNSPNEVEVSRTEDEMGVLYTLRVAKIDMGLIIGKQGTHAQALKLMVKLFGVSRKERVALKIAEPETK